MDDSVTRVKPSKISNDKSKKRQKTVHAPPSSTDPGGDLIKFIESKRSWRPDQTAIPTVVTKRPSKTEDDDADLMSMFDQQKPQEEDPTLVQIKTVNERYANIESKGFTAMKELSLEKFQDCYQTSDNSGILTYRNEDSMRNKYPKLIRIKKCLGYMHFYFVEALKLNLDYMRMEQVMNAVTTVLKDAEEDDSLADLKDEDEKTGLSTPIPPEDNKNNMAWLAKQSVNQDAYFMFFRVPLQRAVWHISGLTNGYFVGIIINRYTMKDAYIALRLKDDSQFSILFHFTIAAFFS